jgi:hypothetical protein
VYNPVDRVVETIRCSIVDCDEPGENVSVPFRVAVFDVRKSEDVEFLRAWSS